MKRNGKQIIPHTGMVLSQDKLIDNISIESQFHMSIEFIIS